MGFGVLSGKVLGQAPSTSDAVKYPWHKYSIHTLELQKATNQALQAAGFCPVPSSGVLDGPTCGARNHLTVHSREYFGRDMLFDTPTECDKPEHADELMVPLPGCFTPSELKPDQKIGTVLTRNDWIAVGGAVSLLVGAYLAITYSGAPSAKHA